MDLQPDSLPREAVEGFKWSGPLDAQDNSVRPLLVVLSWDDCKINETDRIQNILSKQGSLSQYIWSNPRSDWNWLHFRNDTYSLLSKEHDNPSGESDETRSVCG